MHFCAFAYSTQRPNRNADAEGSPFLDMAASFLENFSQGQGGGGGSGLDGLAGIASVIGNMMQSSESGKSQPSGAAQIIAGLGSLLAANNGGGGGGGFDPSIIGNVIQMFAAANSGGNDHRSKRSNEGSGLETVLSLASTFLSNYNNNEDNEDVETNEIPSNKQNPYRKEEPKHPGDNLMNLLPIVMQTLSSFTGADMQKTEEKHSHHSSILPPFLEKIHTAWDHFSNSELSHAIYKKIGLDNVFKGFVGRDGKVDYDKLFETLQNQSYRKRWIQKAIVYLAEWTNYLSQPEVYRR